MGKTQAAWPSIYAHNCGSGLPLKTRSEAAEQANDKPSGMVISGVLGTKMFPEHLLPGLDLGCALCCCGGGGGAAGSLDWAVSVLTLGVLGLYGAQSGLL